MHALKRKKKDSLVLENAWLKDSLMDTAQVLACKANWVPVCSELLKVNRIPLLSCW